MTKFRLTVLLLSSFFAGFVIASIVYWSATEQHPIAIFDRIRIKLGILRPSLKRQIYAHSVFEESSVDLWVDFGWSHEGRIQTIFLDRNRDNKIDEIWYFKDDGRNVLIALDRDHDGRVDGVYDSGKREWSPHENVDVVVEGLNEDQLRERFEQKHHGKR